MVRTIARLSGTRKRAYQEARFEILSRARARARIGSLLQNRVGAQQSREETRQATDERFYLDAYRLRPSKWIIFLQLVNERASCDQLGCPWSHSVLTLFDYKLTARLSPVLVSSTESRQRPTPSGLSSIEPRCDDPVPMAAWSLLSESNIVSRAPASCLGESNCNKRNRSLDVRSIRAGESSTGATMGASQTRVPSANTAPMPLQRRV